MEPADYTSLTASSRITPHSKNEKVETPSGRTHDSTETVDQATHSNYSTTIPVVPLGKGLIECTRSFWGSRSISRKLTDEEIRQIAANVTAYFSVLNGWQLARELPEPAADCKFVQPAEEDLP